VRKEERDGWEGMRESETGGESWTAEERHVPTVRPHEEKKKDRRGKKEEDRRLFRSMKSVCMCACVRVCVCV